MASATKFPHGSPERTQHEANDKNDLSRPTATSITPQQVQLESRAHTLQPNSQAAVSIGCTQHNEFAIEFYNQGLSLPSAASTHTHAPNIHCPYHNPILCLPEFSSRSEAPVRLSRRDSNLLSWMPPLSLTQEYRIGTSTSCGCTCGQIMVNDYKKIERDIEGVGQETVAVVEEPTTHQS
ncbi:hypothetical protein GQ44DRAFT_84173 [Phaeosphaeriaceae sp. PMI808]|nr:hypothetical protein GQ44DRAFT_84173 [Phaeosphaeriaceae sp. PMI808]